MKVNIHADNDRAFQKSCQHGHIEIAKWLYSLDENFNKCFDYAFIISCNYKHFEIVKWLHKLDQDILGKHIKHVSIEVCDHLDISESTKKLLKRIKNDKPFSYIEKVDDMIIKCLAHYNMVDQLVKLRHQFTYINFEISDNKVLSLIINPH